MAIRQLTEYTTAMLLSYTESLFATFARRASGAVVYSNTYSWVHIVFVLIMMQVVSNITQQHAVHGVYAAVGN